MTRKIDILRKIDAATLDVSELSMALKVERLLKSACPDIKTALADINEIDKLICDDLGIRWMQHLYMGWCDCGCCTKNQNIGCSCGNAPVEACPPDWRVIGLGERQFLSAGGNSYRVYISRIVDEWDLDHHE